MARKKMTGGHFGKGLRNIRGTRLIRASQRSGKSRFGR